MLHAPHRAQGLSSDCPSSEVDGTTVRWFRSDVRTSMRIVPGDRRAAVSREMLRRLPRRLLAVERPEDLDGEFLFICLCCGLLYVVVLVCVLVVML